MACIYCADIYCDECGADIKQRIARELWEGRMTLPDGAECKGFNSPDDLADYLEAMDEREYDSDEYPKDCGDDEESDSPQHCGSHAECLDPTELSDGSKVGHFFENALTSHGEEYVREAVRDGGEVAELWRDSYSYLDFEDESENEDEPCSEDYTITPAGPLGSVYAVGQIEGNFLGEWAEWDDAIAAIKADMQKNQFWPNVWFVSDHGNWDIVTLS